MLTQYHLSTPSLLIQNFLLSCLMMQYASSLDPNDDGSYNPLRYYADILNFVFNALFVVELGIRSLSAFGASFCLRLLPHSCCCFYCSHSSPDLTLILRQHVRAVVAPLLPTAVENL
jgi:hypothetical protein